ncbi:DNA repair protein RecO [Anaerovibrio sp.]|uniref:DNA repair protein RecO n=1 Tax=Anaerovibrio sp. TaxID=1872532 RepID=UPI003F138982
MAQYTTEAIIIGIKNWGEADKIITLLSPERGRIKAVAFGCRRPKSPLAGSLQMFNQVEVQVREGDRLDTIRGCSLIRGYRVMSTDFTAMAYGAFVAETASRLAIENFPQQDMYNRLLEIFAAFGGRNPRVAALAAAYQLLEYSGMQMSYRYCAECNHELAEDGYFSFDLGGALCERCGAERMREPGGYHVLGYGSEVREFILQLLELDWQSKPSFTVSGRTLVAAEALLLGYLHHIFERPLKSLDFIRQIG